MNFEEKVLTIPRAKESMVPLRVDLAVSAFAESRLPELSYVNKGTAPELMSAFLQGYTSVRQAAIKVKYEYVVTCKLIEERKATVLLEVVPEKAVMKGVATKASPSGPEDFRNAIITLDETYKTLQDKADSLKAAFEFLTGKAHTFELAYQASKKVYSDNGMIEDHGLRAEPDLSDDYSLVDHQGTLGRTRY